MSLKGKVAVDIVNTETANLDIDELITKISYAVESRLEDYYIYSEKPYLDTDTGNEHVETTLYNIDDNLETGSINWERQIRETIHDLAREALAPSDSE